MQCGAANLEEARFCGACGQPVAGREIAGRYRVVGKLFTDEALIDAWLQGTAIPTKTRHMAVGPEAP